jgi:GNAT superfamily N-acetyltransferase
MPAIVIAQPGTTAADAIVRDYLTDVASRFYGRPATRVEVDQALRDEPYGDLTAPTGVFLLAFEADELVACAGARFVGDVAELTKIFTRPAWRGHGLGSRLVGALEEAAREHGACTVRLDTRGELAEACALYERLGYARVTAFNADPYSDRWYAKSLGVTP